VRLLARKALSHELHKNLVVAPWLIVRVDRRSGQACPLTGPLPKNAVVTLRTGRPVEDRGVFGYKRGGRPQCVGNLLAVGHRMTGLHGLCRRRARKECQGKHRPENRVHGHLKKCVGVPNWTSVCSDCDLHSGWPSERPADRTIAPRFVNTAQGGQRPHVIPSTVSGAGGSGNAANSSKGQFRMSFDTKGHGLSKLCERFRW
jgi:hypothetical protein